MFKENNNFQDNIQESLANQDYGRILESWQKSTELQEEIAPSLYVIENEQTAEEIFKSLSTRFTDAPSDEQKNIITAMSSLGARNLKTELVTTQFLVKNAEKESPFLEGIIKALKNKVMRSTLEAREKQELKLKNTEIISKSGAKFMEIVKGDFEKDLKIQAMIGIYRCQDFLDKEDLISELKKYVLSDQPDIGLIALGELSSILNANDEFIVDSLEKMGQTIDPETASDEDLSKVLIMIGHTRDSRFLNYLNDLKNNPRLLVDERNKKNVEWALSQIQKGELDEK